MIATPVTHPLPGEHLARTWPTMRRHLDNSRPLSHPGWRVRLRFWAGRALTADALELDQENRAAHLAWRGRQVTAGIVNGLETAFECPANTIRLQLVSATNVEEIPTEGTNLAIIARLNGTLRFRIFDSNRQQIVDESDTELMPKLEPAPHRLGELDRLRQQVEDLRDSPAPDEAQTLELLDRLSLVLGRRLRYLGHVMHLLPGHGITALGDDVTIPRPLRVALDQIPVDGMEAGQVPWAAVLTWKPAEFRRFDNVDPQDPCDLDPSRDAFADERRQDGSILTLVPLPADWEAELGHADDPRRRNRLAHLLFQHEAAASARQLLRVRETPQDRKPHWDTLIHGATVFPWERSGLPLALLGSEIAPGTTARRFFLDRSTVARRGGQARPRSRPVALLATAASETALNPPGSGSPALWRARVDQFAEQLATFDASVSISDQAGHIQFAPPAGLLPKPALRLLTTAEASSINAHDRAATSRFFPPTLSVEAVPVPLEDLEAALAASAPLAPFDFASTAPELVRILVPLPQRVFDPRLLVVEHEDPLFAQEIGRLVAERQDWRQRRDTVRDRREDLRALASGPHTAPERPGFDQGQLEPEPMESAAGPDTSLAAEGVAQALLSPGTTRPPWELSVHFAQARAVTADTALFLRIRIDADAPPAPVEARWRRGGEEFSFRWETPPAFPLERIGPDGQPAPTPLWLRFEVRAGDIGLTQGELTGLVVRLEASRFAVSHAGQLVRGQRPDQPVEDTWWHAEELAEIPPEWTRISGGRLLAPFEPDFTPVFSDNTTLDQRRVELEDALNPAAATPRAQPMSVPMHGIETVLAELAAEASEADDFVDAGFTRAQTNLYRIRKLILGETAAQKLLINPAIAAIAEQETANASAEQLRVFINQAKDRVVPSAEVNAALRAAPVPRNPGNLGRNFSAMAGAVALQPVHSFVTSNPLANPPQAVSAVLKPQVLAEAVKAQALENIFGQRPETGPTLPPRGLSIGERFREPPATDNLSHARSALTNLLEQLRGLRLPLVGQTVRSLAGQAVSLLELQGRARPPAESADTPETLRTAALSQLLEVPEITADVDEAVVTLAALDFTEVISAILRTIERVIHQRRTVLERGRETLLALHAQMDATANRLLALEARLAEARHDVSVARALRLEEQQQVAAMNERRDQLIRDEVRFLAFVRPRAVEPVRRSLHYWRLEPADAPAPLPACLQLHDEPPDPLRAYVQLFRHAPARWFHSIGSRLAELNSREQLFELTLAAQQSALGFVSRQHLPFVRQDLPIAPLAALQSAFSIIAAQRRPAAALKVSADSTHPWSEKRRDAEQHVALGDIADGRHGHTALARAAAAELDQIERVATCLHAEFAAVPPAVRLGWVERYSQFDRPSPLNQLTELPRYDSLPRETRRRFQEFAEWLFGRVTVKERDAFNLVNDLVRICLLLASHAPVKQILAGHVPRPVPVRPGVLIPIKPLQPLQVRVGMQFQVWRGSTLVTRGHVEDLQDGEVAARVEYVQAATSTVDETMRVQFIPAILAVGGRLKRERA